MRPRTAALLACAAIALARPHAARASDATDDAGAPTVAARGVAVLATPGSEAAAWPLAKAVYARDALRPAIDDAHARVLAGEPPAADAPRELRDLSEERAGVHGDDAASRALLKTIATQLGVGAIVVVRPGEARVFLADAAAFDAARYAPDPAEAASDGGVEAPRWSGTVASLERALGAPPQPVVRGPALATSDVAPQKPKPDEPRPFYASPWFWGAIGAAAFGGTAVYFATRDNSPSTIHLQLQVH